MELTDANPWWTFEPPLQSNADKVVCSECSVASPLSEWREGEVYCEVCGDHSAMICPNCEEPFDHVRAKPFEVYTQN
jgi:hypothetical protein